MQNSLRSRLMALAVLSAPILAHAQFSLTSPTYTQDFDSLPTSGSVAPNSVIPGWFVGTGTGALVAGNALASTGNSNTGTNYNFGVVGINAVTDRALGSVASGSTQRDTEFRFVNNLGTAITELTLTYTGEQWRVGGTSSVNNVLRLQYSYDGASFTAMGAAFDFNTPLHAGPAGALDGNAVTNRVTGIGGLFTLPTPLANGATFYLRWADADDASADNGVALDDFTMTANAVAASTSLYWDANGVLAGVGGAGVWDTTTSNWNTLADGTGDARLFGATNDAVFGGSAGNVTIAGGGVIAAGLRFDVSGYTVSGGALTLTGLGSIKTIGISTTISAPIAGTSGLTKSGGGLLTLSGPNNFTGDVAINGGSLIFDSDGRLGDAGNDIVLGGGYFIPSTTLTLASTRELRGGGGMQILIGNRLTAQGNVNLTSLELVSNGIGHSNGGTLALTAASNTLGSIILSDPATIEAANSLTLTGNVTVASGVANTCTITGSVVAIAAPLTVKVIDTPQDVDFRLQGNLSGTGRLTKTGAGTLRLEGTNSSLTTGFRLGIAGATPELGGRLLIGNRTALGGVFVDYPSLQFNGGILEAETPLTGADSITAGISFGAGQITSATLTGADMRFIGKSSFFKATGAPSAYTNRITVNNNVSFAGYFTSSTGTGTNVGVLIDGLGTVTLESSSAAHTIDLPITINGPKFVVNGTLGGTPTITIETGSLMGGGEILPNVLVKGILAPGQSPTAATSVAHFIFRNALSLAGVTLMEITRTPINSFDAVLVDGALTFGGSLIVTNFGPDLKDGDTFKLFSGGSYSNSFSSVTLPPLLPGLQWNTNGLATNGTIKVEALSGPIILPVFVSGSQLVLRLATQSGTNYVLQSTTNLLNTNTLWIDVLTNSGTGGTLTNARPIDPAKAREFFRYRVQ